MRWKCRRVRAAGSWARRGMRTSTVGSHTPPATMARGHRRRAAGDSTGPAVPWSPPGRSTPAAGRCAGPPSGDLMFPGAQRQVHERARHLGGCPAEMLDRVGHAVDEGLKGRHGDGAAELLAGHPAVERPRSCDRHGGEWVRPLEDQPRRPADRDQVDGGVVDVLLSRMTWPSTLTPGMSSWSRLRQG